MTDTADTQPTDEVRFFQDDNGQWRWRVRAANHEVIAASTEAYVNRADMVANYERVTGRRAEQ